MASRFALLILIVLSVHAQQPATRVVHVAVRDPMNRFVTGLDRSHFVVQENGVERSIVSIATPDDSVAVAIVAEQTTQVSGSGGGPAEVHLTRSVAEALRFLASSNAVRKALIITTAEVAQGVPDNIFVQRVAAEIAQKGVVEATCRYAVEFASADANTTPVVTLNQPRGLPALKPIV
jgi:hypothetical protein